MTTKETLTETTADLIRFQTTHDRTDQLAACADYIEAFFKDTPLVVERFLHEGIPSVVVTKGTKTPTVFLSGHFDVVPADESEFTPEIREGRLYGRGALDMKSGDAVMMHVMRDLAETNHSVGLMLTGDEEIGGFDGTAFLLDHGYSCQVAVIPDGGEAIENIIEKEKGIIHLQLTIHGRSAHGSMPWLGVNAIERTMDLLTKIRSLFVSLDQHDETHWQTTLNIGTIEGGTATNSVADCVQVKLDIRYTETDQPDEIIESIRELVGEMGTVEIIFNEPHVLVPLDHPLVAPFATQVERLGRTPSYTLDHGSSDGRFFAAKDIPVIISQPDGANLHAPGEWVDLSALEDFYTCLRAYVEDVA